jgi:nucleoside-diphosphate-sugar epimerase
MRDGEPMTADNAPSHPRIAVTGSAGVIGRVLAGGLTGYDIVGLDLPEHDVRDFPTVLGAVRGTQAIVHLAWDARIENARSNMSEPDNRVMFANVYRAALQAGVPRVVMASSVHADDFRRHTGPPLPPDRPPRPRQPYGETKVAMEARGRLHAEQGLEVVCLRFGGVWPGERVPRQAGEADVQLLHRDCVSVVDRCLSAPVIPGRFAVFYAVSDVAGRKHDVVNPLGWQPTAPS